jgi:hypothetical protein
MDVLMLLSSRAPGTTDLPLPKVRTRLRPDCEIRTGELRNVTTAAHEEVFVEVLASTFQLPSTEIGAARCRPLRKTPASPMRGKPTRKMYATTKFRLVRDIEPNLGEEV